jgi:predicted phage terminase large subunit-like protein
MGRTPNYAAVEDFLRPGMSDEVDDVSNVPPQFFNRFDVNYRPPRAHLPFLNSMLGLASTDPEQQKREAHSRATALKKAHIIMARENFNAFMEYCFLDNSTRRPFSQQWYHEEWARAMSNTSRCLIIAPRDHGKCLYSLAFLETPTGRRYIKGFPGGQVLALNPSTLKMEVAEASPAFENGERDVFRVMLASGRSTTVTDNHPFLRGDAWVECKDLEVGDRVGVMVGCAAHGGNGGDELEAWMLGFICGNGSVSCQASISTTDGPCIERIHEYAKARGWRVRPPGETNEDWSMSGANTGYGPLEWLREYDLFGCTAHTKRVPRQVWRWSKAAMSAFVSGYFDADGGLESRNEQLSFSSVNRDLLSDVQALLARLGVNGILNAKNGKYKGENHLSFRLTLRGVDLRCFRDLYSGASRKSEALKATRTGGLGGGRLDLVHQDVWRKHVTMSQRHGRKIGVRFDALRPISKSKIKLIADACQSEPLKAIVEGDVAWEEIVSIEPAGREMTYGIEVYEHHNHVTDGIITHNTSQIVGRVVWELGRNPDLRIKIACAADGRSKERLYEIIQHITYNDRVREVFPNLVPSDEGEWSKHRVIVKRNAMHRDASVEALGITATATGGRCDLLIADDVVDRRNALSFPALRTQIKQAWKSDWTNLLEPDSRVWYICTLWHKDDLSHELMENKAYRTLFYGIDENYGAIWPEKWSSQNLYHRFREIGTVEFNRGFRNRVIDTTTQIVNQEWIKYADLAKDDSFLESMNDLVFFTSYDTARATNLESDYSAGCIIAVDAIRKRIFVIDAWHGRFTVKKQSSIVWKEFLRFKPYRVLIEKVGQAVLDEWVINDHPEIAPYVEVTTPHISKVQRLLAVTPLMESGMVVFSDKLNPNAADWKPGRENLIHELDDFPFGRNDDLVDAFSQALAAARGYLLDEWACGLDDQNSTRATKEHDAQRYLF